MLVQGYLNIGQTRVVMYTFFSYHYYISLMKLSLLYYLQNENISNTLLVINISNTIILLCKYVLWHFPTVFLNRNNKYIRTSPKLLKNTCQIIDYTKCPNLIGNYFFFPFSTTSNQPTAQPSTHRCCCLASHRSLLAVWADEHGRAPATMDRGGIQRYPGQGTIINQVRGGLGGMRRDLSTTYLGS